MSASNWARCPRCTEQAEADFRARDAAIQASYGQVPVHEFDAARRDLAADRAAFERRPETFREDYEIYGAAEGEIVVDYSGHCEKCGLGLDFKDTHPIPGWRTR